MSRRINPIILKGQQQKDHAIQTIKGFPSEPVMEVSFRQAGSERNLIQNSRMWAMLEDISQQVVYHGQKYSAAEFKDIFSGSLAGELKMAPSTDGQRIIILGLSTSKMSIKKMSLLIEFMFCFGAENKVAWTDPTQPNYENGE